MRNNKSVMFAVIAALLAAGMTLARAEAKPSERSVGTFTRVHSSAYAAQQTQAGKVAKSCTYRGGPKSGIWDCR